MKNFTKILSTVVYIALPLLLMYFAYDVILSEASKICYFFGSTDDGFFPNTMVFAIAQLLIIPVSIQIGRLYKMSAFRALVMMTIVWNVLLFAIPLFFWV